VNPLTGRQESDGKNMYKIKDYELKKGDDVWEWGRIEFGSDIVSQIDLVLEMLKQETIEEPLSFVNSLKKLKMYYENQHEDDTPQINIKEKPTDTED
tara:strand:+ start:740 stop:1030 length:291 start_codon:yes stop_codon:yes gene_type:complete